jgi:hypothetical protein
VFFSFVKKFPSVAGLDDLPVKRYTPELSLTACSEEQKYIFKMF